MDASAVPNIPDLDGVVEAARDNSLAVRVKVKTDDLGSVSQQSMQTISSLHVPEARRVVHATGGDHSAVRVEGKTHNFRRMSTIRVVQLAGLRIPQLTSLVKRSSDDLIAVGIVEGYCIHDVSVALEGQQLIPSNGVPNFACSVVTSGDEFITRFVKSAIC